jgi:carboxypeptidase C (cathepsin A)
MKKLYLSIYIAFFSIFLLAQEKKLPIDTLVVTQHKTTIKGQTISYEAQTGRIPVWNGEGKPIASLFFTYYKRTNISNNTTRPLVFSFNGGPGAGSLWMHMGYTGPRILKVDSEGYPVQPYGFKSNPYSILDVADIVFVNPVNVGYSRIVEYEGKKESGKTFFGVNQDIKYLAEWISTFVSRKNRWDSPKYLIGESYGGVRVMGLSHELQEKQWI